MRNSYLNEYIRIFRKAVKKEVWQLRVSDNDLCLAAAPLFGQLWKCGVTDRFLIVWRRQLLAPITVPDGLWFNGVPTQLLGGFGPFSFFCFHFYCFFILLILVGAELQKEVRFAGWFGGTGGRLADGCASWGTMATTGSDVTAGSHKHELDAHFYGLLMWHLKTRLGILSELYPFSRKGYTSKCLAWLGVRGEIATHRHNRRNVWMFVWG